MTDATPSLALVLQRVVADAKVFVTVCDIADFEAVERAVADANAFHGRATDHVVHAAMVTKPGYVWEQDPSQLQQDMGATYLGAVHLFKVRPACNRTHVDVRLTRFVLVTRTVRAAGDDRGRRARALRDRELVWRARDDGGLQLVQRLAVRAARLGGHAEVRAWDGVALGMLLDEGVDLALLLLLPRAPETR